MVSPLRVFRHCRAGRLLCRSSLQAWACRLVASRRQPAQPHRQARPTAVSGL